MAIKSVMVTVRVDPEQQKKLRMVSRHTPRPGNLSAALRYLIEQAAATPAGQADAHTQAAEPMPETAS